MVGYLQLLQARKHIQNFLNSWPETLKFMKNQWHITRFIGFFFTTSRRRKSARTILQFRGSTEQYWATSCGDFLQQCQANPHFIMWIVTEDECSVFLCILVTKHHSMDWRTESSLKSKTFCCYKKRQKIKSITFLDKRCLIHKKSVTEGKIGGEWILRTSRKNCWRAFREWSLSF